jgi:hypothetical protein
MRLSSLIIHSVQQVHQLLYLEYSTLCVIAGDILAIPGYNLQCSLDMVICSYTCMVFKSNYLANEYALYRVQTLSNPST